MRTDYCMNLFWFCIFWWHVQQREVGNHSLRLGPLLVVVATQSQMRIHMCQLTALTHRLTTYRLQMTCIKCETDISLCKCVYGIVYAHLSDIYIRVENH